MSLLVLLFTFAKPWVLRAAPGNRDLPPPVCSLPRLGGRLAAPSSDVDWEIKGDPVWRLWLFMFVPCWRVETGAAAHHLPAGL